MRLKSEEKSVDLQQEINVTMSIEELMIINAVMGDTSTYETEQSLKRTLGLSSTYAEQADAELVADVYNDSLTILDSFEVTK